MLVLKCNTYYLDAKGSKRELATRLFELHNPLPVSSSAYNSRFDEQFHFITTNSTSVVNQINSTAEVDATQHILVPPTELSTETTAISNPCSDTRLTMPSSTISSRLHPEGRISATSQPQATRPRTNLSTDISTAIEEQLPNIVTRVLEQIQRPETAKPNILVRKEENPSGLGFTNARLHNGRREVGEVCNQQHRRSSTRKRRRHELVDYDSSDQSTTDEDEEIIDTRRRYSLPPLPDNVISRIRSGKFVSFDKLLPHSSHVDISDDIELIANPRSTGLTFSQKTKNKAKVVDFASWSIAWSVFALYYTVFFIGSAMQIMGYHNRASELAAQYSWDNFQVYDKQFRQKMANDRKVRSLRWDRIDEDLRARHLTTPRNFCSACQNFGHSHTRCPDRRSSSYSSGSVNNSSFNSTNNFATRQDQSHKKLCYQYKNLGSCSRQQGSFAHVCIKCGKNHPVVHCPTVPACPAP